MLYVYDILKNCSRALNSMVITRSNRKIEINSDSDAEDEWKYSIRESERISDHLTNILENGFSFHPVHYNAFISCDPLKGLLTDWIKDEKKYPTQVFEETGNDIEFYMVGDNYTQVKNRFDKIRYKRHKFICLNDNIKDEDPRVCIILYHFV